MRLELDISEDQKLFADTTVRFVNDTVPLTKVRELAEHPDGFERDWWRRVADLGWTSMLAGEDVGGSISGDGLRDLTLVAFELGRRVSPGPFAPTNVVISALAGADRASSPEVGAWLTGLVSGDLVAAACLDEPGRPWGPEGTSARAERRGDHLLLTGTKGPVEVADQADLMLVAARLEGEVVLVVIPRGAEGLTVRPQAGVDLVRRFGVVELDGVAVPESHVVGRGDAVMAHALDVGAVLGLAETLGAIDRVFEFTLEWTFDRYSFGRPLASYQALKHRIADLKLWLEASRATTAAAIRAVGSDASDASALVSVAKSYVGERAAELIQDCVQLHGGIGVTWEHDIHLYLRRVTLLSATFGTTGDHRERLAATTLGA